MGACCELLNDYEMRGTPGSHTGLYGRIDNERFLKEETNVRAAISTIYWMAMAHRENGVGPSIGRWNHNYLPLHLASKKIKRVIDEFVLLRICMNRLLHHSLRRPA